MEVKIGKAGAPETPASCMGEAFLRPVTDLMVFNGIEAISYERYSCGFGSHLHVTIAPFADAPKPIRNQGVLVKDSLAKILSAANITRVVIKMTDTDLEEAKKSWGDAVKESDAANGWPAQEPSDDQDGPEAK